MVTSLIPDRDRRARRNLTTTELIKRGFDPRDGRIDILFIFPPASIAERYGKGSMGDAGGDLPPLGITTLAAYLREKGFGVGLLDCCALGLSSDEILDVIRQRDPKAIGISSTTYALPKAAELSNRIRDEFAEKLVVLGGAHANVAPLHAAENYPCFDVVVTGDGELTIHEVMSMFRETGYDRKAFLADTARLRVVTGILFREGEKVVRTLPRAVIEDLDSLPLPARDLLPMERYIPLPNQYKRVPVVHMVTIRGCPYVCTFCDQAGTGARSSSPERTVAEIRECVERYGAREISFWDDTMTFNKKWMREMCERLIAEKLDVVWSCYCAVKTVDKPLLEIMKAAGCWNIFYGYETGVPELMKNIGVDKKNGNADRIREVNRWTKEAGIEVRGSFMLGLPGETPELAEQTIRFAIELDPEYAQFSITTPYPGTRLYDEIRAGKWGRLTTEDFSEFQGWNVVFLPDGYKSKEEVWSMERKAFRSFYFRPSYIIKRILAIRSREDLKRYWNGFRALVGGFAYGPMPDHVRQKTGRT